MMIAPETYYEFELKGKPAKKIEAEIRELKKEMRYLKKALEDPRYDLRPHIHPDESVRLSCARDYLRRAVAAYEEAGGTYMPDRNERRAAAFGEAIPSIRKITLRTDGIFSATETRTAELTDGVFRLTCERTFPRHPGSPCAVTEKTVEKEVFFDGLRGVFMGEWKRNYDPSTYGMVIADGLRWEVTVEYFGRRREKFGGYHVRPFSFESFRSLLGDGDGEILFR